MADSLIALNSLIEARQAEIRALLEPHNARSIAVFGSVARGEATVDSDVDFLVEFDPGSSLLDLIHLEEALCDLLDVDVDVISLSGRSSNETTRSEATLSRCEPIRRSRPAGDPTRAVPSGPASHARL